jgi:hypothetical protein
VTTSIIAINLLFIYLNPPIGFEKIQIFVQSLKLNYLDYAVGDGGTLFNNSIFGFLKIFMDVNKLNTIASNLSVLSIISYFLILFSLFFNKINRFTSLVLLSCNIVFLTPTSPDYRLSFLIIPVYYALLSLKNYYIHYYSIVIIFVIMLPKHFYVFTNSNGNIYTLQSIINPVFAIILCAVVLMENFKDIRYAKLGHR